MKKIRRNNFNMVEIMLAVIVIALGIAGTFVLFPVGLNANKEAAAENSIADIAEYIAAFVQARTISAAVSNENGSAFKTSDLSGFCAPDADVRAAYEVDEIDSDKLVSTGTMPKSDSLYEISSGIYLYRQLSGPESNPFVDFSAVAKVYLDQDGSNKGFDDELFINSTGSYVAYSELKGSSGLNQDFIGKFMLPVVIELSWPANVPEADRDKRYFRFEIFNDQYDLGKDTTVRTAPGGDS